MTERTVTGVIPDAEKILASDVRLPESAWRELVAKLLAELEQTGRERDRWKQAAEDCWGVAFGHEVYGNATIKKE